MLSIPAFRRGLLDWFDQHRRDLPWRRTDDPWAILVSEVMLQQTRVETVIPYFERFLNAYPAPPDFARATEQQVLAAWAGLGYYSRARNLQRAARAICEAEAFPRTYQAVRALPGAGDYTAAAVASIAFNLPHAALDGNIARVISRLTADPGDIRASTTRSRLQRIADQLLAPKRPGDFNQAMMELGAVVCVPRSPSCLLCPVSAHCEAFAQRRQHELPVRAPDRNKRTVDKTLLLIVRRGRILVRQRPAGSARMPGFWDFPDRETLPAATSGPELGSFRHTIVNTLYRFTVISAQLDGPVGCCQWWPLRDLGEIPLSTAAKKAVPFLKQLGHTH